MTIDWNRWRPALVGAWHIVGALLIAYAFIVVLMTASLQNQVADSLGDLDPPLDYSTAYTMTRESRRLDTAIAQFAKRSRDLGATRAELSDKADDAFGDLLVRAAPFNALLPQLEAQGCPIAFRADNPDAGMRAADPDAIARALIQIRDCKMQGDLPAVLVDQADLVLADADKLVEGARAWWKLGREAARTEARIADANRQVDLARAEREGLSAARRAFDTMSALDRGFLLGGGMLTELPPAIIHIVLAFVAGTFGALLLTLVFVVYPGNGLNVTTSQGGYGARILLGGLVSVCVFVVIGGGTAVLGASSALAEGESNFLAFCAIGILAGMFSDRVTVWLSDRANTFFASQGAAADDAADPPPADDAGQAPEAADGAPGDEPAAASRG